MFNLNNNLKLKNHGRFNEENQEGIGGHHLKKR